MEDVGLPPESRRSEDRFGGEPNAALAGLELPQAQDICEQLLLDSTRATFVVDGDTLSLEQELLEAGVSLEDSPEEFERFAGPMPGRLVGALRRSLGGDRAAPSILVRAVSAEMSQSGLAHIERACGAPQVVVSGGEQSVNLELRAHGPDGPWDLELRVRKWGFELCVLYGAHPDSEDAEPSPLSCGPQSCVERLGSVRFWLAKGGKAVEADVLDVRWELRLVDGAGRPLTYDGQLAKDQTGSKAWFGKLRAVPGGLARIFLLRASCSRCARRREASHGDRVGFPPPPS